MKQNPIKFMISIVVVLVVFVLGSISSLAVNDSYPDINTYDSVTTLRGVQGQGYDSQHSFFNCDIRKWYLPDQYPPCGIDYYEFEGKGYRFFDAEGLFSWLWTENYYGRTTNVQFMVSWEDNNDAGLWDNGYPLRRILIDSAVTTKTSAYYYAPATTGEGRQIMRAFWSWMMTELTKRQLHIDNFILGNEVNAPIYWNYAGEIAWPEKVQKYAISFFDMRQIIRSFSDKPRISICLDHSWNHDDEGRGITARNYLTYFDGTLTAMNGGKQVDDWCISMHLYPAVLTWPKIWTDKPGYPPNLNALSDTASFVDGRNLRYFTNYVKNTYGENHRIMLTEQGFTSHLGEDVQAAALVYSYYAAKYDPMVDCFILMVADSGTELMFSINGKKAGYIYPSIDDPSMQSYIDSNLLSVIGVTTWSQIVPDYGQTVNRKSYVGSGAKYVIDASPSVAAGGSVTGMGTYEKGQEVSLTAMPSSDYYFVAWKENGEVVSTSATYDFAVQKKRTLVAEFQEKPWIAFEANGGGGSMSGLRVEPGTAYQLPECKYTAIEGMQFDGWEIGTEKHQPGETITVSESITIKALWMNIQKSSAIIRSCQAGFEGNLHLYFNMMFSDELLADEGAYVEIIGEQYVKILIKDGIPTKSDDGTEDRLTFPYLTFANELRKNIVLKVYDGNNKVVTLKNKAGDKDFTEDGFTYSLYTYATNMANSSDAGMAALAQATIDYGTAAQYYFNYETEGLEPLRNEVLAVSLADLADYTPVSTGTKFYVVEKRTLTGSFESDNAVYISYYLPEGTDVSNYEFRVCDMAGNLVSSGAVFEKVVTQDGGVSVAHDVYRLSVQGLAADALGNPYVFKMVPKNGDEEEWTVTASVMTYARSSISKESEDPNRANLGRALYLYYLAAKAYFD